MTTAHCAPVKLQRTAHPRLTMTAAELQKLRADPDAVRAAAAAGEAALAKTKTTSYTDCFATLPAPPFPAPHPYNKAWPYWTGICSEVRAYLETLARGWAVGQNRKCYDAALSTMLAIASWKQWTDPEYGTEPCLDTFSLTRGMALAYDLLCNDLKPEDRATVQKAILEKGLQFIYARGKDPASYVGKPQAWPNGFAVINTAMGVGGLALLDDVPDTDRFVSEALAKMNQFFTEVAGPDGGLVEGFMYGSFAVDNFTDLIVQAHDVCGIDAMQGEYLAHASLFPAYFTLPGGGRQCLPAIGDNGNASGLSPTLIGLNHALVKVRQDPVAAWYLGKAGSADAGSAKLAKAPADLPIGRHFASIEWAALRDSWSDTGALMAFKCGFAEHHNHLDQGHFALGWDKQWVISDPGYQIYDMDYPPERKLDRKAIRNMHVYTAGTEGHNTILVDGHGQNGKAGSIPEFFSSHAMQWAVSDATACYDDTLSRFRRCILQVPGAYFLVCDDIVAKAPASIEFSLHTTPDGQFLAAGAPLDLDKASDARAFVIHRDGGQVAVDLIAPARTTLTHRQWPDSKDYGHYVAITTDKAAAQENAFVLRPGPAGEAKPALTATWTPLAARARALLIGGDHIVINPDAAGVRSAALTTDAKAAFVGAADGVTRYAAFSGTQLAAEGNLLTSSVPISVGVLIRGKTFLADIEAARDATITLHCPVKAGLVSLNGIEHPVDLGFDNAAQTVHLTLSAGRYTLTITQL